MTDTIFALSSGGPPAAIGVIRISGPAAGTALMKLGKILPKPRVATYQGLRDSSGELLDRALVLWLPGTANATGEDSAELHCHGGRAVIAAVERELSGIPGFRRALPGEFTRRSFVNGKLDLAEAEGLADLLFAETELQRRCAMAMASGQISSQLEVWRSALLQCSARLEVLLDFADEDDVAAGKALDIRDLTALQSELAVWLGRPRAELLRDGFRVVLAGPPNAGKSTLFNALVEADAAITAPIAGTTRDILTRSVALDGVPFVFADTAGLHDHAGDAIEAEGIARARAALGEADIVLWLGPDGEGPEGAWEIEPQADLSGRDVKTSPRHRISALTGFGMRALREDLINTAQNHMPKPGEVALNARQHRLLEEAHRSMAGATDQTDLLLMAENLRQARLAFDALVGRSATEDMLDSLFGRFCIGK